MKTERLTLAAAVVKFLKNQYVARDGVEHRLINGVFGIFGHGNVTGLGQALQEYGGRELPFYQPKNEQAMVHTSIAYAKARKALGTYACTTSVGPGATNMVTGAATATINRLPVLLLPGDIFAGRLPGPVLQQLEHPRSMDISVNDCFKPVSQYWDRINRPEQVLQALPEAMRVLSAPELMGAVTIALPEDVQTEAFDYPVSFFEKRVYEMRRRVPGDDEISRAADLIRKAEKPFIIAGGGVHYSDAGEVLSRLVKKTHIPVGVTQAGKSSFDETSTDFSLGAIGTTGNQAGNQAAREADLVICVGTRLSDFTTASKTQFQNPRVKFLNINVNDYDAAKHGALRLVGDARATLEKLMGHLNEYRISGDYERSLMELKERWRKTRQELTAVGVKNSEAQKTEASLRQAQVIRVLNETLDEKSTVVHAAGGLPGDLHKLWDSKGPGDYHSEYGYSCMGYEIAGALGVKLAQPDREVYAVLGDGSYLMLNHEIVTSLQEGVKITVVLLDNHGYQCIHNLQKSCGSSSFGNEFKQREPQKQELRGEPMPVDYMANARSLGAVTFKATTENELRQALKAARSEAKTCLIYVPIEITSGVQGFSWWDVPVAEVSSQAGVNEARQKYQEAKKDQRFYY